MSFLHPLHRLKSKAAEKTNETQNDFATFVRMGSLIIDPVGTMLFSEGTCVATGKGSNPDLRRSLYSLIVKYEHYRRVYFNSCKK